MIRLPADHRFAIAVSGVVAEKTGAAMQQYNRASRRAAAVASIWREATGRGDPHLSAIVKSNAQALGRLRELLREQSHDEFSTSDLLDRLDQFVAESEEIIPAVPDQMDEDGLQTFGQLVARSQELGARLLGNQLPETEFLAARACELGAVAASAFGAGFGGSVWALIPETRAEEFSERWREVYTAYFPKSSPSAEFFATSAGPSAILLEPARLFAQL
jgi:galactokinase